MSIRAGTALRLRSTTMWRGPSSQRPQPSLPKVSAEHKQRPPINLAPKAPDQQARAGRPYVLSQLLVALLLW